jgi:hypothetical protein
LVVVHCSSLYWKYTCTHHMFRPDWPSCTSWSYKTASCTSWSYKTGLIRQLLVQFFSCSSVWQFYICSFAESLACKKTRDSSSCLIRPTCTPEDGQLDQTWRVYICNKQKKSERQPELHVDITFILKHQIYTLQHDGVI